MIFIADEIFDDCFQENHNWYLINKNKTLLINDFSVKEVFWISPVTEPPKIGVKYFLK